MIREKHKLKVKAIPKRRADNGKGSRHGHGYPGPMDKKLPLVQGAYSTKG